MSSAASGGDARAARVRARIVGSKRGRQERGCLAGGDHAMVDATSLRASEGVASWPVRVGRRTRDRLAALRFVVDPDARLAGWACCDPAFLPVSRGGRVPDAEHAAAETYLRGLGPCPGQTGHCEPDFAPALSEGIDGLRARVRARAAAADTEASFLLALDGLAAMIRHAAAACEAAMAGATPERRAELSAMAAACRRVACGPPASFREAIQLGWFILLGIMLGDHAGLVVPGRIDRWAWPFYARDIARGALTRDAALELLEDLYFLINDTIPDGLAMSVMVGGRDAEGRDTTNELSYLCLEALRRTKLVYPTVGVCWHAGTPPALVDRAVELIADGYATPALFGDETIQRGLRGYGLAGDDACHYINSTCVEITPSGCSNVWVASPYFSTCRLLLDEVAAQAAGEASPTFEAFLSSWLRRAGGAIEAAVATENRSRDLRRQHGGKPLQSVFTRDCIARGRDIDDGGARVNWVECSFVGLANLADALHVIREEVYAQRRLTMAELKRILDADFAGYEAERQRFLNGYPKYGNAVAAVDELVGRVVVGLRGFCARHRVAPDDSPFVPGSFCWIMHERLGAECGATPDGRRAGFPFADGGGPAQGREQGGPTAAILSTTSWDHAPLIGGVAYNIRFARSLFRGPAERARLRDLLLTYLARGGFEVQVNVVDHETLRAAQACPEAHADLVVRIGGYTDYFVRLSPGMQAEVMQRTEFAGV